MDVSGMRESYERGALDEDEATNAPLAQFERWFADAVTAKVDEPNAMTLATVGDGGRPSTRVVLMKSFDASGIVFYTNYRSRKGCELDEHPFAALQFFWPTLQRVVRIEGAAERVSAAESDAYFAVRPLDSRLGAWASPQSEVIPSRALLLANVARLSARYGFNPPRPDCWGGYRVVPDTWEFWQGRKSRLHDRLRYRLVNGAWIKERLAP